MDKRGEQPTVRHHDCELFVHEEKSCCSICKVYKRTLASKLARNNKQTKPLDVSLSSHVNNRYLHSPELRTKLALHQKCRRNMLKQINRLKEKLEMAAEDEGVILNEGDHEEMKGILNSEYSSIAKKHSPNSFARLFWEQQLKASNCKNSRQMRWHPTMIKWCLYLRHKSASAYEVLKDSGCVALPSQRTLRDYTHCFNASTGFSNDIDHMLMSVAKLDKIEEWQKIVGILIDEMYIREDLVYNKHTGQLSGFANLGEINEHLLKYEKALNDPYNTGTKQLAKTMMTFMVKGIFTSLQFPYAFFPCCGISNDLLHKPLWECIYRLEKCGFKVLFITADGASTNRALFQKHDSSSSLVYKVPNKYATDERNIYFISDPPHLIKTTRNCWASSQRQLMVCYSCKFCIE